MTRELELISAVAVADGRPGPVRASAGDGPKHATVHTECLNCGDTLHGRFCARCGQASDDHHRSIFHLMWEAVEGLTHLDGRLARTVPPLFLRPGSLARDHFEGRRQRHVPPFRLFLVSLLLFMLALETVVHHGAAHGVRVQRDAAPVAPGVHRTLGRPAPAAPVSAPSLTAAKPPPGFAQPRAPQAPQIDPDLRAVASPDLDAEGRIAESVAASGVENATSGAQALNALEGSELGKNTVARWLLERAHTAGVSPEYFSTVIFEWAHRLAILLLPIFALLLTLCYVYRRKFYVYDHLVVAMQFLSFIFLVSAIAWILPSPLRSVAVGVATVWTPVNLFMILRGAYGSSILGALVKAAVLWLSTLFLFLGLLVAILVVALGQMH